MHRLNEKKRRLEGEKLSKRMAELAELISTEHGEARAGLQTTLEHARQAGEWLIEAKERKGGARKWGNWKRWLEKEYTISTRTMSIYMQVANHWDDPRIIDARIHGLDSIAGFLRALKGEKIKPKPGDEGYTEPTRKEEEEEEKEWYRKRARKYFAAHLRTLDKYELEVLEATVEHVIEAFNRDLRMRVDGSIDGDYYRGRQEYYGIPDPRIPPDLPARPSRRRVGRPQTRAGGNEQERERLTPPQQRPPRLPEAPVDR